MKELVDIVGKDDELTGKTASLEESHRKELLHRISAVLIFRPSGDLLMQRHKKHRRLLDHSVGGHVSAGESYEIAAQREMQEELNLNIPIQKIREGVLSEEYYPHNDSRIAHMFGVFVGRIDNDWQLASTEEVDELVEMPLQEVIDFMNKEPDQFLQGFLSSMGAYLVATDSVQKISAYGKTWGEL